MNLNILITGAGGQLGSVLMRCLTLARRNALGLVSLTGPRPEMGNTHPIDLLDADAVAAIVRSSHPACIIHAAAMTVVNACFERPSDAEQMNVGTTRQLVELAAGIGASALLVSTDLVFDGETGDYNEESPPRPTTVYGQTKRAAEQLVLAAPRGAVARMPLLYGLPACKRVTTFTSQLSALRSGRPLPLFRDEFRSPIWLEDAAAALERIADSGFHGLIHAGGPERLSRLEIGRIAAAGLGLSGASIVECSQRDVPTSEPRPADVSMQSNLFTELFGMPCGQPMREAMAAIAQTQAPG